MKFLCRKIDQEESSPVLSAIYSPLLRSYCNHLTRNTKWHLFWPALFEIIVQAIFAKSLIHEIYQSIEILAPDSRLDSFQAHTMAWPRVGWLERDNFRVCENLDSVSYHVPLAK